MKSRYIFSLVVMICGSSAMAAGPVDRVSGDYVEARTASVFAGACHYNGEVVTTGKDAVLAWNITAGNWNGADLTGVKAMAAVTCQANLGDEHAPRKAELIVDQSATPAQVAAFKEMLQARCGSAIGQIVSVRRAPVQFVHDGLKYSVKAGALAALSIEAMPNNECCLQPNLVWYSPLVSLEHRKVGMTENASYAGGSAGDPWQRGGENSAFYGRFNF